MMSIHDHGVSKVYNSKAPMLRAYEPDSPQAKARLVVLAMLADGRLDDVELDDVELDSLDRDGTLSSIGISREDFFAVLYDFCADVEAFPRGRGDYVLAPAVLQKILSEVSDGEERQKLLRLIFDVIRSDGRLAKGEAALFWHAVDTWSFRAAETRAALYRQRRPVAARAARRSVRPL